MASTSLAQTPTQHFSLESLFSVRGKHVLITGAGTGLGLYKAKGFVANGAIVYIVGRRKETLEEAKVVLDGLAEHGGKVHIIVADVSDRTAVTSFVSTLNQLDVLINTAGVVYPDSPTNHLTPLEELQASMLDSPDWKWSNTFKVNVETPYFLSVSLLHLLAKSKDGGRIINISSIGSYMSDPHVSQPAYQISKSALNHLTRILASKFREYGVRVNGISPGYFPSQMNDPSNPKSNVARAKELVPLKRAGTEEDIAGTAIWLASQAGSYVDGQVIPLGGGREWS